MNEIRVALIGCGKIADQHMLSLSRVDGVSVVAVCDQERLMAQQLAERFGVHGIFSDPSEMLAQARPDVVHITTPPQGHATLAQLCLASGAHVYIEKPFTVTYPESVTLINSARTAGRLVTAGHNYQFTSEMCELQRLIRDGFVGDRVIHMESHFPYDLGDTSYVGPLIANRSHWVRQLPGQLLHNLISHGIARFAEYLSDDVELVSAYAFTSAAMRRLGGAGIHDELRVLLTDDTGVTATFCFSSQIKPARSQFIVHGVNGSVIADQMSGTTICLPNRSHKSYLTYFLPPLFLARDYFRNAARNITAFAGRRLYQDSGMTEMLRRFYSAIRSSDTPPIPYREILLTAKIMDQIFQRVYLTEHRDATNQFVSA